MRQIDKNTRSIQPTVQKKLQVKAAEITRGWVLFSAGLVVSQGAEAHFAHKLIRLASQKQMSWLQHFSRRNPLHTGQ